MEPQVQEPTANNSTPARAATATQSPIHGDTPPAPIATPAPVVPAGFGKVAPPLQRLPGEPEPLTRSLATILEKSGYRTPERQAEIDRAMASEREKSRQHTAKLLRHGCNVWPRFKDADLDDVDYARHRLTDEEFERYLHVRDELRTLLDAPGTIVLCGPNGPGKSHLASALVHAFCDAARPAYYVTALDFYRGLKSTFGERGRTAEDYILRFRRLQLLVIDEIEVRSESKWENDELRGLVDARYGCLVATVIVTNKTKAEINGTCGGQQGGGATPYFSTALRDRIRQDGGILECNWPSLRGRIG